MKKYVFAFVSASVLFSTVALANDKNQYHLFNPTPKELMREMSTDRPDKTESPYTVDSGHIQIETGLINYAKDKNNIQGSQDEVATYTAVETNFKLGLNNQMDLQLVAVPYIYQETDDSMTKSIKEGPGDLQTRLKINLWGNDEGSTALGLMPFVKFPTNGANLGNEAYESGIIIPLGVSLPNDWGMGIMAEFDFKEDSDLDGYHTEFIQSITFSHAMVGNLSAYVEFFSNTSNDEAAKWLATVDSGLTYAMNDDVQLDLGINAGVTRAADDINLFSGATIRY